MCPQRLLTLQVRSSVRQTILLELVLKGSMLKGPITKTEKKKTTTTQK